MGEAIRRESGAWGLAGLTTAMTRVTLRDNRNHIGLLLDSFFTTMTGWGWSSEAVTKLCVTIFKGWRKPCTSVL